MPVELRAEITETCFINILCLGKFANYIIDIIAV